ncbi:hypothetical protein HU200_062276 [Digitaria exilis]|uniref:Uncharacterized protein n=1 Tax=Digitaria exilis TaxID=1010633 RepID=A0A835A9C5_9POAL|nr:hypothetical protein HU200_062276 [Digitaria exilis]
MSLEPFQMTILARQAFGSSIFREILILACWAIWYHMNSIISDQGLRSFARWRTTFVKEIMKLLTLRRPTSGEG